MSETTKYVDKFTIDDDEIIIRDTQAQNDINTITQDIENLELTVNNLLSHKLNNSINDFTLTGRYFGEIVHEGQASAVVKHNTDVWTLGANNYDGYGSVEKFDIGTNTRLWKKNVLVGHANSACYNANDGYIYVVPRSTYTNGTRAWLNGLYRYDSNFENRTIINTPCLYAPYGVTFDYDTNTMYIGEIENNILSIYKYENSEFTKVIDINISGLANNGLLPQDIAIKNNIVYVSNVARDLFTYDIDTGDKLSTAFINNIDGLGKYYLGETEGMEFDENGDLFIMNAGYLGMNFEQNVSEHDDTGTYRQSNGVIIQIPFNNYITHTNLVYHQVVQSANVRETNYNALKLSTSEFKNLSQIVRTAVNVNKITVLGTNTTPYAIFNDDISIEIAQNATLYVGRLFIYGGDFALRNLGTLDATQFTTTYATDVFYNYNRFSQTALALEGTNNGFNNRTIISPGYFGAMTITRALNGITGAKIGASTALDPYSIYVATTKLNV